MEGVFNHINSDLYHYGANNPVKYTDPDGNDIKDVVHPIAANPISVVLAQKGIFPNETTGFSYDSNTGLYHATFDCWQGNMFDGYIGYNNLYDKVFDTGTSMEAVRFDFSSDGKDYTLWGWKGDYLNLGAGCELGIYEKASGIAGSLGHFKVNKDLAMDMQATLTLNGKNVGSFSGKHWWATSFNPNVQNAKAVDLKAQFSVNFENNKQLYSDFKNKWEDDKRCSFNDETNTVILNY